MKKRVLIITYYWPPSAGSGVQRWLKFSKYLPEFGWEPVIYTPQNPDFDLQDESLLEEVSDETTVLKSTIWEPYQVLDKIRGKKKKHVARIMEQSEKTTLEKVAIWARANLLIPDPRIFWVKPSVKTLLEKIEELNIDAMITTGPPHSMHLIGAKIHDQTGLPWIADFRDPWSEWELWDELEVRPWALKKHQSLEADVLANANAVTTISQTFKSDLERLSGRKIELLTNGYDPADLPSGFSKKKFKSGGFRLVYTGIIDSIRNPIPVLRAFKNEFEPTLEDVKFTFVGQVSDVVRNFVQMDDWLSKHVEFPGYFSHEKVFEFYARADVLVLILTNTKNSKGNIPGKLFEYLSTGVPILALGDSDGDSAKILKDSGGGEVLAHQDELGIQRAIRRHFLDEEKTCDKTDLEKFSRKNLTKKLASILDDCTIS
ncbi:glycosyltransferase family 4 protein [Algoriphagus sediminis]|uniref:Glycosyltransferase family 4 protein n=1 Tax=Algoriphagus sediminis TaxID=3057113 RepID=A0ABT7Y8I8_9BACT|nr:glycosyltransferase family 4 protein [Algoriphagus sediminis]MDN3202824.1 glycosyltransferase family 4 protein [Algoriphagus sediminis]